MAKDEDELQVITDPDAEGETVVIDDEKLKQAAAGDERTAQVDDDDGEGDGQVAADPATEALRAQRRLERKAKKLREHQARDRNRKELDFLRQRNEELERRQSMLEQRTYQTEYSSVDTQLSQIEQSLRAADEVIEKGVNEQDGASVREATNIKAELQAAKDRLLYNKQQIAEAARQAQTQQQQAQQQRQAPQQQVAREVIDHANAWKAKNPWYKPGKADNDSRIVAAIDDGLVAEGMDPREPEYWDELTDRVKASLPHQFGAANGNGNAQERRGPAMANGGRERALKSGEMYVSAERKEALIQAGVWDDTKLRNKYLKRYADYDEAARRNA